MRKYALHKYPATLRLLFVFTLLTALLFAAPATYLGTVVAVTDRDTIQLLDQRKTLKVRLANIDAPERGQAFGTQSKKTLSDIVYGKEVLVVEQDRDRYGRVVGCTSTTSTRTPRWCDEAWPGSTFATHRTLPSSDLKTRQKQKNVDCGLIRMPFRHGNIVIAETAPRGWSVPPQWTPRRKRQRTTPPEARRRPP